MLLDLNLNEEIMLHDEAEPCQVQERLLKAIVIPRYVFQFLDQDRMLIVLLVDNIILLSMLSISVTKHI